MGEQGSGSGDGDHRWPPGFTETTVNPGKPAKGSPAPLFIRLASLRLSYLSALVSHCATSRPAFRSPLLRQGLASNAGQAIPGDACRSCLWFC
ncbi:MAG: hypothetical protein ACK56F_10225 [bacterium]